MSNYSPIVTYGPKDSLAHGDPNKAIKGSQMDAELNAIATAISTKLDNSLANIVITGAANQYGITLNGSATSGQSFGELITAGSTSADNALLVRNNAGGTLFRVRGDGEIFCGPLDLTPIGGTFVATLSGMLTGPATLGYLKMGPIVRLYSTADYLGAYSAAGITITSIPVALRPTITLTVPWVDSLPSIAPQPGFYMGDRADIAATGVLFLRTASMGVSTTCGLAKSAVFLEYFVQ